MNRNGNILAYGVGYDWHKGYEYAAQNSKHAIMLHPVSDDDCKPKPPKK
jgi:mRNA export factor